MANTASPFGFRAFGHRDGSPPTQGLERVFINSSDTNTYFTGDLVSRSSVLAGTIQPYSGSSLAPLVAGVFAGCEYYTATVGRVVWNSQFPASVGSSSPVTAYIISDPEMQFIAQCSTAGLGSSQIGCNCNVLVGTGNTLSGISGATIASSLASVSGSSYPFRFIDVYSNFSPPGVNGTDNSSAFNIIVVAPNNWDRKALTGTST